MRGWPRWHGPSSSGHFAPLDRPAPGANLGASGVRSGDLPTPPLAPGPATVRLIHVGAWITGTLAALSIAFLVVGFLRPSTWDAGAELWIDAPVEAVYPWVHGAEGWLAWTPAPDQGVERFGPVAGAGSGYRWDDPDFGSGEFRVTAGAPPRKVAYEVQVEGGKIRIQGRLDLEPEGAGTRIRWTESGDFGRNPLLGYMASRMEALQGTQLRQSLETLQSLVTASAEATTEPDPASAPPVTPDPPG